MDVSGEEGFHKVEIRNWSVLPAVDPIMVPETVRIPQTEIDYSHGELIPKVCEALSYYLDEESWQVIEKLNEGPQVLEDPEIRGTVRFLIYKQFCEDSEYWWSAAEDNVLNWLNQVTEPLRKEKLELKFVEEVLNNTQIEYWLQRQLSKLDLGLNGIEKVQDILEAVKLPTKDMEDFVNDYYVFDPYGNLTFCDEYQSLSEEERNTYGPKNKFPGCKSTNP